jgi:DNA-binding SARP family transcriptional activator
VDNGYSEQWKDTVNLLRLVQNDFEAARKQLDTVSQALAEKQNLTNQRLQQALLQSSGYQALCLLPYDGTIAVNRIGNAFLAETVPITPVPETLRLEIRCFDRFEVTAGDDNQAYWQSLKARSILQFLMTRPREAVARELIMEAMWPDHDQQTAGNNLKVAIHSLRKTINRLLGSRDSSFCILYIQGGYMVNPDIEIWFDVEEFERHWTAGRRLERAGNASGAVVEFELAEALYRGDYLEDFPYDEWTLLRREILKDTYLIILGKLADYYLDAGDYENCIIYCQKIMAKDPCREDTYRRLIRCYSRLGNKNRSLRWYELCCQTMLSELDINPDQETVNLYYQLLKNEYI